MIIVRNVRLEIFNMIKVEMVCYEDGCNNTVDVETHNRSRSGCFIIPTNVVYICGECGEGMIRRITKVTTKETEEIVS